MIYQSCNFGGDHFGYHIEDRIERRDPGSGECGGKAVEVLLNGGSKGWGLDKGACLINIIHSFIHSFLRTYAKS